LWNADGLILDFGKKKQVVCHFLFSILVRSSSRDKRFAGGDPYLLSLLYNSSMWLLGTGTADASEAMLSHRSSTSRIFSGVLNLLISGISVTRTVYLLSSQLLRKYLSNPPIPPFLKGGEGGLLIFLVRE
jgi:hypothetical protein